MQHTPRAGLKFSGEYGAGIGAPAPRAPSGDGPSPIQLSESLPATEVIDDERKTVTALFADWLTERFDTADLKETKVLLDELAS
jgi:hypothetical protein